MCGIAGICSPEIDESVLNDMIHSLHHRGPDARGVYIDEGRRVALGNVRLSIMDLSEQANQPMISDDGKYIIIYNGEIYEFNGIREELRSKNPGLHFNTHSDTEVILSAYKYYGKDMLSKLEGMFALAVYDRLKDEVFLCRDRLGKKPLFYYHDSLNFIFASEIKALLKHPVVAGNLQINNYAIYLFLHLGYIPEPYTIYECIKKFPAAHYALYKNNRLELNSYWNIEKAFENPDNPDETTLKLRLKEMLARSVRNRMISDVPLGIFLSGGTDSSLVAALATDTTSNKLKTYSIGFNESKYDESGYARQVAGHLRTDHHEFRLNEVQALNILEKYIRHFDEPFADTSAIPTLLVSELARKEVKVALTGDGGDELFLGYGAYDWANRLNYPSVGFIKPFLAAILRQAPGSRLKRVSHLFENVPKEGLRSHIFSQEQYFFSQEEIQNKLLKSKQDFSFSYNDPDCNDLEPAEKQALFDIRYYLRDDLLVKTDRASMYHSLECRSPFLDYRVAELAVSLPYRIKKRGGASKWILKEILKDYLPVNLIYRPKWGFSIPLNKWLRHDLQYLINSYLNQSFIENTGIVESKYVKILKDLFLHGNDYLYNRIWLLIVLHKWMAENG